MKMLCLRALSALFLIMLLTSCGSDNQSSQGQGQGQGYKDTKTMVLDVLKSDDGQKAIQESADKSQDPTVKLLATGEGQQIQLAVKDILTTTNGSKMIEKMMVDPKFAGQFAQAIQSNNKQIHKDLMKDPEYQKSMIEVMNNPEFEKIITGVMKNTVYRQQMMNVIQESMQSPLFKTQLLNLLKKVVEEGTTPKVETLDSQSGGNSQSGGESKSGGGGQSGQDKKSKSGDSGGDSSSDDSSSDQKKDNKDKT